MAEAAKGNSNKTEEMNKKTKEQQQSTVTQSALIVSTISKYVFLSFENLMLYKNEKRSEV